MTWLESHWTTVLAALAGIHAAASAICALTPTPRDDAWLAKYYRWLERAALLIGRAKER